MLQPTQSLGEEPWQSHGIQDAPNQDMLTMEVKVVEPKRPLLSKGTAGMRCHAGGQCATVSALAGAFGGIGNGRLVETSIG